MSPRSGMDALTAHAELRLATLARHPLFRPGAVARDHVLGFMRTVHEAPGAHIETLERAGVVHAVLAWAHFDDSFFGTPVDRVVIDHTPDAPLRPWLDGVLGRELPRMGEALDVMVDAHYPDAIRALLTAGLGLDSVQLLGDPRRALSALGHVEVDGLELRPLREADIERTLAHERAIFAAEPQWCFFGAADGFVAHRRTQLAESVNDPAAVERSILWKGNYIGHASASVRDHGLFGALSGMSFALDADARGHGLARPIYRHLLRAACDAGAICFRGGTSQPPVLHLGKIMGRSAQAWLMRRRVPFAPPHFAPYAPAL